jgi:hypothetical protein
MFSGMLVKRLEREIAERAPGAVIGAAALDAIAVRKRVIE